MFQLVFCHTTWTKICAFFMVLMWKQNLVKVKILTIFCCLAISNYSFLFFVIYKDISLHSETICKLSISSPLSFPYLFSFKNIRKITIYSFVCREQFKQSYVKTKLTMFDLMIYVLKVFRVKFKFILWSTTFSKSYHGEDDLIIFSCIRSRLCKFNFSTG